MSIPSIYLEQRPNNSQFSRTVVKLLHLHHGDILDLACLVEILRSTRPSEVYNLAGQSHVTLSFKLPEYTFQVNQLGCLNLLQAIRICNLENEVKFYQVGLFSSQALHSSHPDMNSRRPRLSCMAVTLKAH